MKYLLFALLIFCSVPLRAQDNPLRMPIDLLTGRVQLPTVVSQPPAEVRKAGIKMITVQSINGNAGKRDTTPGYRMLFSDRGDQVNYHWEFRDFKGFNSIRYNADGTVAVKQWKSSEQAGCGTGGMALWFNKNYREYTYKHGRPVLLRALSMKEDFPREQIGDSAGTFTAYGYDDRNRLATEQQYAFDPWKPGDTLLHRVTAYRYNRKGQLLHHFVYDALYSRPRAVMDSLIDRTPGDFTTVLLRQSYRWNKYGLHPGPPSPDLSEEEEEVLEKNRRWRDSLDFELSDFYLEDGKNSFLAYTGYEYDPSGMLTGMICMVRDELSRRDTFVYDRQGQLVAWESWHLDSETGRELWEPAGFGREAQHWTWQFTYDGKGRVRSCRVERSQSDQPGYSQPAYRFRPEEEITYLLDYDARGKVIHVREETREHHYGFNPEVIPPLTTDTTEHLVLYERW